MVQKRYNYSCILATRHEDEWGSAGKTPRILNLEIIDGRIRSDSRSGRLTLDTHWIEAWVSQESV